MAEAAFSPRDTCAGITFDGKMWLSNAYQVNDLIPRGEPGRYWCRRDLWSSVDGRSWDCVSDSTPYDPYSRLVAFDGRIWAVGEASVFCSEDGSDWRCVASEVPFGASATGAVAHAGRMWLIAGSEVWSSADGAEWSAATLTAPFGARTGCAVEVFDGKIWLLGGSVDRTPDMPGPEERLCKC